MCSICTNPGGEKNCCCFNLSIALLVIAAYFGTIGGLDIYQSMQTDPYSQTQYVGGIVNAAIGGYVCLCVLLGFLKLGLLAYIVTFGAFVVLLVNSIFKLAIFITDWVHWGKAMHEGTMEFKWVMITASISQLLTIAVILSFANLFWSAACVYRAGGNGCEFKSYKQIEGKNKSKKEDADATTEV